MALTNALESKAILGIRGRWCQAEFSGVSTAEFARSYWVVSDQLYIMELDGHCVEWNAVYDYESSLNPDPLFGQRVRDGMMTAASTRDPPLQLCLFNRSCCPFSRAG